MDMTKIKYIPQTTLNMIRISFLNLVLEINLIWRSNIIISYLN